MFLLQSRFAYYKFSFDLVFFLYGLLLLFETFKFKLLKVKAKLMSLIALYLIKRIYMKVSFLEFSYEFGVPVVWSEIKQHRLKRTGRKVFRSILLLNFLR